jgi:NADH:ubiquinone oxidoreductase subunit 6 (subunit J)
MILEFLAIGLVVSAFLSVYLDEAIYSIASLAVTLMLVAILYTLNGGGFAAIFQLAISVGTLAVLFLSGETLTEKPSRRSLKKTFLALTTGFVLSVPSIVFPSDAMLTKLSPEVSFPEALWNLRAIDVILQGLVIMTVALGIIIVVYEKRRERAD